MELFFEDRQLEIPKTLGELEAMEVDAPISLIQIYTELANRLVRGTDSIAHVASFAAWRYFEKQEIYYQLREEVESQTGSTEHASCHTHPLMMSFVQENLRFNPSIGLAGKLTESAVVTESDPPERHFYFDIVKHNRQERLGGSKFRLP